jgi:hypothetical protein
MGNRTAERIEAEGMKDDLTELARICLEHAKAAQTPKAAAALRRMAKDYERRAAPSGEGKAPKAPIIAERVRAGLARAVVEENGLVGRPRIGEAIRAAL